VQSTTVRTPSRRHAVRRAPIGLAIVVALLVALFLLLKTCNRLPPLDGRTRSAAIAETGGTRIGRAVVPLVAAHPGRSGVYPLQDARNAFAARALLADAADRTLDVQYYIWRNDMSGTLLLEALHAAADRGVRVRLLLDDNNTSGLDPALAALDAHGNVEVRLFNPFAIRRPRALGYVTDFSRLNRRMHNKSFTADNQATIVGGRNVGDEYFGATDGVLFADLDVLAVGPVVREVSAQFDRYWSSRSAYPLARLVPAAEASAIAEAAASEARVRTAPAAAAYLQAMRDSPFFRELTEARLPLEWAVTRTVSDDPAKVLGHGSPESLLTHKIQEAFGKPASAVSLISPYFVPAETGTALFTGWARRGVKVQVLTNSLEATDVTAVHAGYAKRRKALLAAGVTLYELRRRSAPAAGAAIRGSGSGSSGSSLHAKTFAVDHARLFIGSFNFDPRSAALNTEIGFVIDSPVLARRLDSLFTHSIPHNAYELRLDDHGAPSWLEHRGPTVIRHDTEPGIGRWGRAGVWVLAKLPIEWLL
jgi:putative cardiolipin synthase